MKKEKKPKKLKCYVLTVSRVFPATHQKKGRPTDFISKILEELKLHTIRQNYELWKKRIDDVNNGLAYISVRCWDGAPYNSSQTEYLAFSGDCIGIQKLEFDRHLGIFIDDVDNDVKISELAKNDGLTIEDFRDWFKPIKLNEPYAIIHFTNFRYPLPKDEYFKKVH